MSNTYNVGSIVKTRNREWVVLPSNNKDLLLLKPLGGSEKEISGIYLPLNVDKIEDATFPYPDPDKLSDLTSIRLLRDAFRLSFRSGAGPFRSMGRISVRPRPYQFVPLLMGLRQENIRLLIADDVGVGKTVEALMIARELFDRGEISSIGVVCPPHLCEQWQREMSVKFNLNSVVIRANTISQLERIVSNNSISVFKYFNLFVTSLDYVKSDRRKDNFLLNLPDLIIIDEAHTCTKPIDNDKAQQQRYELVSEIAKSKNQNLLLLTATPHSGKEEAFLSLIGHLNKDFEHFNIASITNEQRIELAKFFIQRKRGNVEKWIGVDTPFPKRISDEQHYKLSSEYASLFKDVYEFLLGLLKNKDRLAPNRQMVRYWAALGLLRSIMSSPDAGISSLMNRISKLKNLSEIEEEFDDSVFSDYVSDSIDSEKSNDLEPSTVVQESEEDFSDTERRKLREFASKLETLRGERDFKLIKTKEIIEKVLKDGFKPIIFCRFIATAEYVSNQLQLLFPKQKVIAITSELAEEEREEKINWLASFENRILVATDCLSEGVNLQDHFDAVIHYDLPWNPNRLEQREGRVDRFGQKNKNQLVKTVILYGEDNPIDGAVLNVLIRKAVQIHKTLGISVPVPVNSESVIQSVINSLFYGNNRKGQLEMDFGPDFNLKTFHAEWDRSAEREQENRSRFAQVSIKPAEVAQELNETDLILGNPETIKEFIISSTERLGGQTRINGSGLTINPVGFEPLLREKFGSEEPVDIAFDFPIPEGFVEVGRDHIITSSLADYILECSFEPDSPYNIHRCSAIRTDKVSKVTYFYLLRVRYLIDSPKKSSLLAEELITVGYTGDISSPEIVEENEANSILDNIQAIENIDSEYSRELIKEALDNFSALNIQIEEQCNLKANRLQEAHTRLRNITKEGKVIVKPQTPVDIISVIVLVPVPKGMKV